MRLQLKARPGLPQWCKAKRYPFDSFSNHISAPFTAYPDFVSAVGIDIEPLSRAKSLLGRLRVVGKLNGKLSVQNEVRRLSGVRVRRIVSVPIEWIRIPSVSEPPSRSLAA